MTVFIVINIIISAFNFLIFEFLLRRELPKLDFEKKFIWEWKGQILNKKIKVTF